MPKVSVIIPTYNCADYICEAIEGALNQTYQDFEIIVVDDGSTDNTKSILQKYNGKIRYFYKENGGIGSARNLGIHMAQSHYIALLDADDIWMNDLLEEEINHLEKNKFDLVYSSVIARDINGNILGYKPSKTQENTFDWIIRYFGHMHPSSTLVKRECFEKIGYFDETLIVLEDYDMWLRIAEHYKIGFVPKVLAMYRRHNNNISNKEPLFYAAKIQIFNKWLKNRFVVKKYKNILIERIARNYYLLGKSHYNIKAYPNSLRCVFNAIRYKLSVGKLFWEVDDNLNQKILKILKPYVLLCINICLAVIKNKHVSLNLK